MKTNHFLSLAAMLCISLFFSCSSDSDSPPPPQSSESQSSDGGNTPGISSSSVAQSSSSVAQSSSSGGNPGGSSSSGTPTLGYCDYGRVKYGVSGEQGGCFPMGTAEDKANCAKWGKEVVGPCGVFTDERDGQSYKYVIIGTQTWMGQNLDYNASGGTCNNIMGCIEYAELYNWSTAIGVCPSGWHLPSDAEWDVLITAVGGEETAGYELKAKSEWYWDGFSGWGGPDTYGFSALPGGYGLRRRDGFSFSGARNYGYWWSATESNSSYAYYKMSSPDESVSRFSETDNANTFFSVRCIKD